MQPTFRDNEQKQEAGLVDPSGSDEFRGPSTLASGASTRIGRTRLTAPKTTAIFILSSWYSGSTWVGYVLGSGPESAFVGEYHRAWNDAIRVPCTVCAARGLQCCEVLYDVEKEPADKAFDLAVSRTGKRVIVDNSKSIDWIQRFSVSDDQDMRIILVIKDPRGYFESARRRGRGNINDVMAHWCKENQEFRNFMRASNIPSMTISYDSLAKCPKAGFRRLFKFCGMTFTKDAIAYWNIEHHGFAANGASDAILKAHDFTQIPEHFATGDDAYYRRKSQTFFHDERWRTALSPAESRFIQGNAEVKELLDSLGFALTETEMKANQTVRFR
jgi:hypothetical protein